MSTWSSKEWKEKRKKRISGQSCQQCGNQTDLQVHHNKTENKLYWVIERRIIKSLIKEKMDKGEIPFQGTYYRTLTCENCNSKAEIYNQRYKNYTCPYCKTKQKLEGDKVSHARKPNYKLGRQELKFFIRKYRKEIDLKLHEKNAPPKPDYMNLDLDTAVLCKTCHYALENGYDLCPTCKKNYKKFQDLLCSKCIEDRVEKTSK